MDSIQRNIFVDDRLESYRNFFSDDWARRINALVDNASTLDQLVFDLIVDWRGAAYTVSFPAHMLEQFKSFAEGFANDPQPNTDLLKLADRLLAKLAREVPEVSCDPALQRKLQQAFVSTGADLRDACGKIQVQFPLEQLWQESLNEHVYQLTIWSSLRICYVAVYNAYDNFVAQCTTTAYNGASHRTTDQDFSSKFRNAFGKEVFDRCWGHNALYIVRQARHALSHAGGRVTQKLARQNHDFRVEGGVIQIIPADVKSLYSTLKDAAYALADAAKDKPEFKQGDAA